MDKRAGNRRISGRERRKKTEQIQQNIQALEQRYHDNEQKKIQTRWAGEWVISDQQFLYGTNDRRGDHSAVKVTTK